ncbi:MAG: hypothetical protein AB8G18_02120 [Gammaproteobacteria bacterium]
MSSRGTTIWAVCATVVAVIAVGTLGFVAGKNSSTTVSVTAGDASSMPTHLATQSGVEERDIAPKYTVPLQFASLPDQWRTPVQNSPKGYAALFDPKRRELIVEQCEHPGFQIDENGRPQDITRGSCVPILWSSISTLTETIAVVRNRDGNTEQIELAIAELDGSSTLSLGFSGHRMTMIPGSRNDLVLAMENTPDIAKQKQAYNAAMLAERPTSLDANDRDTVNR